MRVVLGLVCFWSDMAGTDGSPILLADFLRGLPAVVEIKEQAVAPCDEAAPSGPSVELLLRYPWLVDHLAKGDAGQRILGWCF